MNEACLNLLKENIAGARGREFTLKTMDFMRQKLLEFQEETGQISIILKLPLQKVHHTALPA